MNWEKIWIYLFGSSTFWGLDLGFWISMAVILLIVLLMNIVFWSMPPKDRTDQTFPKK